MARNTRAFPLDTLPGRLWICPVSVKYNHGGGKDAAGGFSNYEIKPLIGFAAVPVNK